MESHRRVAVLQPFEQRGNGFGHATRAELSDRLPAQHGIRVAAGGDDLLARRATRIDGIECPESVAARQGRSGRVTQERQQLVDRSSISKTSLRGEADLMRRM